MINQAMDFIQCYLEGSSAWIWLPAATCSWNEAWWCLYMPNLFVPTYDAWFSCASNQVAQVLLTLPYSFSQLGIVSGILFQVFYRLLGSWTAYLISILYVEYRIRKEREKVDFRNHVIQWFEVLDGLLGRHWRNVGLVFNCTFLLFGTVIQLIACASNIYYINDKLDKRTWTYIFGACCATTVFIPSFHNYRVWSFLGLVMTTYTAWYLTVASLINGQIEGVKHSGPTKLDVNRPNEVENPGARVLEAMDNVDAS